ncbi:hypothetical protein Enr13x_37130 [Stieleria neptunia]|uniref:PEP-CTERM protein-sorting domain-containing protein n=1 Tax=Stieleria neptunia TaxID=2527979 RepID=A0A518HSL5_9BACT|nr:hypothetical protein [Stieleria neptunia]QDV43853.1 hypothetical protein Enr13x_37130 [Stieleria neptunia]
MNSQKTLSLTLLTLVALFGSTDAAEVTVLSPNGSSFAPGEQIEFRVTLPELSNLGSYETIGVLTGSNGSAGVQYFFEAPPAVPAASKYVFDNSDTFLANPIDAARVSLSDFTLAGMGPVVFTDVNDGIASVFVNTASTFSGEITLSIDAANLVLDQPDGTPVSNFATIQSDTAARGFATVTVTAIPEPGVSLLAFLAGMFTVARRGRRTKRVVN